MPNLLFEEPIMRNMVDTNPFQQRVPFLRLESFVQTQQSGRFEKDPGDTLDSVRQVFDRDRVSGFNFLIEPPDEVIDMVASSHISGFVFGYSFSNDGVLFFIRPLFRRLFFLILIIIGKEVVHNGLIAYPSISDTDDLECSGLGIECSQILIQILPLAQEFRFCCGGFS